MNPELARFIVHTRETFARLSFQQLYQLALALAAELHDRHVDAEPEAYALCAALLAHANGEQRKIFSADCGEHPCTDSDPCAYDHTCRAHRAGPAEEF